VYVPYVAIRPPLGALTVGLGPSSTTVGAGASRNLGLERRTEVPVPFGRVAATQLRSPSGGLPFGD
jgi:hypothetical protein